MATVLASTVVHTQGVNWEATGALLTGIGVLILSAAGFIAKRSDGRTAAITHQVETFAKALTDRLDKVDGHLDRQSAQQTVQGERLARVEGQLSTAAGLALKETTRVASREHDYDLGH